MLLFLWHINYYSRINNKSSSLALHQPKQILLLENFSLDILQTKINMRSCKKDLVINPL